MRHLRRWAFNFAAAVSAVLFVASCLIWIIDFRHNSDAGWVSRPDAVAKCRGVLVLCLNESVALCIFRCGPEKGRHTVLGRRCLAFLRLCLVVRPAQRPESAPKPESRRGFRLPGRAAEGAATPR